MNIIIIEKIIIKNTRNKNTVYLNIYINKLELK